MAKTPFLKDAVFMNNCKIPVSFDCAEFISQEHHGIQKWFPQYRNHFDYTKEQAEAMLSEKDEALEEVKEIYRLWTKDGNPGFNDTFYAEMSQLFALYIKYVELFCVVGHSYVIYKYCQKNNVSENSPEEFSTLLDRQKSLVSDMKALEEDLQSFDVPFRFQYPVLAMMNPERLRVFREDVEQYIESFN